MSDAAKLDAIDRALIVATQGGLPLVARPYQLVGEQVGVSGEEVMARLQAMLDAGIIRRIGAVPNHYAIGWTANGMTVWDVADERVDELGGRVGSLDFVTHCYRRPRVLPDWPYNLFCMIHGRERGEVESIIADLRQRHGLETAAHEVLFSLTRFKQNGARYA